jgi:hypothetical protein
MQTVDTNGINEITRLLSTAQRPQTMTLCIHVHRSYMTVHSDCECSWPHWRGEWTRTPSTQQSCTIKQLVNDTAWSVFMTSSGSKTVAKQVLARFEWVDVCVLYKSRCFIRLYCIFHVLKFYNEKCVYSSGLTMSELSQEEVTYTYSFANCIAFVHASQSCSTQKVSQIRTASWFANLICHCSC